LQQKCPLLAVRPWLNTQQSNSAALRAPTLRMMLAR
jgi:hypothetical protein